MATAELAIALPVLVLVAASGAGLLQAVEANLRCESAARVAARAAARGDPLPAVIAAARQAAPAHADVRVDRVGASYEATVTAKARIAGPWSGAGPEWEVSGHARSAAEDNA